MCRTCAVHEAIKQSDYMYMYMYILTGKSLSRCPIRPSPRPIYRNEPYYHMSCHSNQ